MKYFNAFFTRKKSTPAKKAAPYVLMNGKYYTKQNTLGRLVVATTAYLKTYGYSTETAHVVDSKNTYNQISYLVLGKSVYLYFRPSDDESKKNENMQ